MGQRKGIGIGGLKGADDQSPFYVLEINKVTNTIKVGSRKDLEKYVIYLKDIHLIRSYEKKTLNVDIKFRSSQKKIQAKIKIPKGSSCGSVQLENPAAGISPGQACVFYKKNELIGGGWIVSGEVVKYQ